MGAESAAAQHGVPPNPGEAASAASVEIPVLNVPPEAKPGDFDPAAGLAPSVGEQSSPDMAQSGHEHSERAKNMTLQEALGATGCTFMRQYAVENGKDAARQLFDVVRSSPPQENDKPFRRSVPPPPPKKKPGASLTATEVKKAEVPKDHAKVEAAKNVDYPKPQPLEAVPAAVSPNIQPETKPIFAPQEVVMSREPVAPDPVKDQEVPLQTAPAPTEQLTSQAAQSAMAELQRLSLPDITLDPGLAYPSEHVAVDRQGEDGAAANIINEPAATTEFIPEEASEMPVAATVPSTETSVARPEAEQPAVTFDRFTEALQLMVANEAPQQAESNPSTIEPIVEHPALETPVAAVATEIATKLTELTIEQKEVAMPIVQTITESLRTIRQLQVDKTATPKEIITAVEQMREQILQLLEAIDITYDDQKIERFLQAMLALVPNVAMYQQSQLTPEELAKMGTREVKLADQFFAFLSHTSDSDDKPPTSHRIGRLAVFITHPSLALQLWAKADDSAPTPA